MYEAEVNNSVESIESLTPDVRQRFAEFRDRVASRTTLPWGEHCTECVWPSCYSTCELYSPRKDGACRQFIDGVVRIDHKQGLNPYLTKIRFKQWAKLWTVGNLHLKPLSKADQQERLNIAVGAIGQLVPAPASLKPRLLRKISYLRRRSAETAPIGKEVPDCFLLECFNPNARAVTLTFTMKLRAPNQARPFQTMIHLAPGYTRAKIAFSVISQSIDVSQPFEIEIVPNDCDNTVLYFGLMDFVKENSEGARRSSLGQGTKQLKCVVWDLDNTVWDGTLIEDGIDNIRLRPAVLDVMKQLDERGILQSIASKNSPEDVLKALRVYGIEDYFLFPQISWRPKSESIAQIAKLLNIGIESFAFVDDQQFEREEVHAALPQLVLIDAADCLALPERPECQVPLTAESRSRRLLYREEEKRQTALESYNGDYLAFLKDCRMEVRVQPLDDSNMQRVYELAQRTNQLNFSGNRYQQAQLEGIRQSRFLETYVVEATDRFGNYGIVGFGVVDVREPRLLDLMFSCRIQSKRAEHAILSFLLNRFVADKKEDFHANYRKTPKNAPGGRVFDEVGFECVAQNDGVSSLVFRRGRKIPDDKIIKVTVAEQMNNAS